MGVFFRSSAVEIAHHNTSKPSPPQSQEEISVAIVTPIRAGFRNFTDKELSPLPSWTVLSYPAAVYVGRRSIGYAPTPPINLPAPVQRHPLVILSTFVFAGVLCFYKPSRMPLFLCGPLLLFQPYTRHTYLRSYYVSNLPDSWFLLLPFSQRALEYSSRPPNVPLRSHTRVIKSLFPTVRCIGCRGLASVKLVTYC